MAVNLRHQFFAARAVVPHMKAAGGGSNLNLGSISWHLGLGDLIVYQTAKAAIEGLTRSLARELGRDNIRVNAIVPGNVRTERQQQWYRSEEHTSELQSLMRISFAVFCLTKKNNINLLTKPIISPTTLN